MTLPDSAKPRNKRLSFYKFVVDSLSNGVPVIVQGCSDLFAGWVDRGEIDSLCCWIELLVDSFSGGVNSKMKVRFVVCVRDERDDANYQMKRMDEVLETVLSLMNLPSGEVIPVYDFSAPAAPARIGENQGLGFIPRHTPDTDGFAKEEGNVKRYELHYELWLWQEGVAP